MIEISNGSIWSNFNICVSRRELTILPSSPSRPPSPLLGQSPGADMERNSKFDLRWFINTNIAFTEAIYIGITFSCIFCLCIYWGGPEVSFKSVHHHPVHNHHQSVEKWLYDPILLVWARLKYQAVKCCSELCGPSPSFDQIHQSYSWWKIYLVELLWLLMSLSWWNIS